MFLGGHRLDELSGSRLNTAISVAISTLFFAGALRLEIAERFSEEA